MTPKFESAFESAQVALGLSHYDVKFKPDPDAGNYANADIDAASCTAVVRVDAALCERDGQIAQVAVHEVLHLLIADLRHAIGISREAGDWVEEQTVRKIEAAVFKGLP